MVSFGILHILILWTSYEKEVCMYSHHITLHGEMPFDVYVYIYTYIKYDLRMSCGTCILHS